MVGGGGDTAQPNVPPVINLFFTSLKFLPASCDNVSLYMDNL